MDALEQIHRAAQYLAAAGKSFLEHKEDDSHTNLGFDIKSDTLETWPFDDQGLKLGLNYRTFSLIWKSDEGELLSLPLSDKSHEQVLVWIRKSTNSLGIPEPYSFELHYDLPYEDITPDYTYNQPAASALEGLIRYRTIAQRSQESIVQSESLDTDIRIWPHHFDTGGYVQHSESIGIGFGMAIPDSLVDDFYLYTSGYRGHEGIDTLGFKDLDQGSWLNSNFKGAVLRMTAVREEEAIAFFKETLAVYLSL